RLPIECTVTVIPSLWHCFNCVPGATRSVNVEAIGLGYTMFQMKSQLQLAVHGAELYSGAMSGWELDALRTLADTTLAGRPAVRLTRHETLTEILGSKGSVGRLAVTLLGEGVQPLRATMFNKTAENNWSVGWHQDRTIAVRVRHDIPGFGPWSVKAG